MALAILVFTHIPSDRVPRLIIRIGDDKFRHVLSYGLFAAFLFVGLRRWLPNPVKALAWVAVIGIGWAGIDEVTQPLAGRTCSLLDFLASLGGTLLGGILMLIAGVFSEQFLGSAAAPATANPPAAVRDEPKSGTPTEPSPSCRE